MDTYKKCATKILELYQLDHKADIMPIFNRLSDEEQVDLYAHILEYYGGFFAIAVIIKTFTLFEKIVIADINKTISHMRNRKIIGIETLGSFLMSHTPIKIDEFIRAINETDFAELNIDYDYLARNKIDENSILLNLIYDSHNVNSLDIEKILKLRLPA
jgi:hypothetical protein